MPSPLNRQQERFLKKLGSRVKELREEKGLSLQELGNLIGKDRQSIHKVEKGDFNPSIVYLMELCKGLDISITQLLNGIEYPKLKNPEN